MKNSLKNSILFFSMAVVIFALSGCVVKDFGQTVEQTLKGDYFLQRNQSERGRESFSREVQENPDSALANYYYGRFLLREKDHKQALKYLRKASELEGDNAEYHFWAGVAYGANGVTSKEEKSYVKALAVDESHLQSLIYLGHIKLAKNKYREALQLYTRALDIWPDSPSALYNRGLILNKLGRTPEERLAWLYYLNIFPSGEMARMATDYLNTARDYNFRNHRLGEHTITTEKIRFVPFGSELAEASYNSLFLVGEVFSTIEKGNLQVLVYQKNNKELARRRAIAIKKFLLDEFPALSRKRIGVSWFSEPENTTIMGKKLVIDESVRFFVSKK